MYVILRPYNLKSIIISSQSKIFADKIDVVDIWMGRTCTGHLAFIIIMCNNGANIGMMVDNNVLRITYKLTNSHTLGFI